MISLKSFELQHLEHISAKLTKGSVGLIYLDIAKFSELEQSMGRLYCEQILTTLKTIILDLQLEIPSIFTHSMVGDDFFLYVNYERVLQQEALRQLIDLSIKLKYQVEHRLHMSHPDQSEVEMLVGSSLFYDSADKELETIIYTAMKQAIRQAKQKSVSKEHSAKILEFNQIIQYGSIRSVYQPIVSLTDANIFGFEALTRGPEGSEFHSPLHLFQFAEREGGLYSLDKLAREKAIQNYGGLNQEHRIFINIPAHIIHDPQFTPGNTMKLLQQHGLQPSNVVFEITERSSIEDFSTVKKILEHYRSQGYQIAIDDAGAGYSSLQAIAELQPDFIKVDRSLIQDIHRDKIKENILETFVTFASKMNIRIIAEGIEQMDELAKLIRMGVHYGQGFLLGKPSSSLIDLDTNIVHSIEKLQQPQSQIGRNWNIGDLASSTQYFENTEPISKAANYFKKNPNELGVVVVSDQVPVGLMMRERLFQQLAGQYGVSLFWNKSVDHLMDRFPLIVDEKMPLELVSQMAMARDIKKLYDFVIIIKEGSLLGVASIRSILECITNIRMESARTSNPLTGLPGNQQIKLEVMKRVTEQKRFSVIYADLDYFKWFNDRFGFQKGDEMIQFTADILQISLSVCGHPQDFVGHIGGDDFILLSAAEDPRLLCEEIIRRFEQGVVTFFKGIGNLYVEDRKGRQVDNQGVTISLSLVICENFPLVTSEQISSAAAKLKKKSKAHKGSIYFAELLTEQSG